MKGIKILGTSTKYSGEISLRLDRYVIDGKAIEKEIVEHRNSVGILPIVKNRESESVILVTQYRRAADTIMLEIPAGKVEGDETPLKAAQRELAEETGYKAASISPLVKCYLAPGYDTEFMTIFVARNLSKTKRGKLDDDENIRIKRIKFQSALRKCLSGDILDCKTIAALSCYAAVSRL